MNNKELEEKLSIYKATLQRRISDVVSQYLPGARQKGIYYIAGDVEGNPGKSFSMNATSGVWEDFATAQAGDILEFFKIRTGTFKDSLREIESFLGIENDTMIRYEDPVKDWTRLDEGDEIFQYLNERGITDETIYKYERFIKKKKDREGIIAFLCGKDKKVLCVNYKKTWKTEPGETKNWLSPNSRKCLWGTDHVDLHLNELGDGKLVVVTEGMEDALSFAEQGFYAVSIPAGASNTKWIEESSSWLKRFEKVIIATDNDDPGDNIASIISRSIGAPKCFRANFGAFKDANEVHLNEGSLASVVKEAKSFKPKSVLTDDEVIEIAVARQASSPKIALPFLDFHHQGFDWMCRSSELTVIVGQQTSGKSAIMYNAAAYYLFQHGAKIAIMSPEMYADGVRAYIVSIARMHDFEYIFANPTCDASLEARDYTSDMITYHPDESKRLDDFYEWLDFCAVKGVQIVFVDALQDLSFNQEDFQEVMEFMRTIQSKAMEGSMHIFLAAHTGKGDFSLDYMPTANSIRGSNTIASKAYNILAVGRNFEKWKKMRCPSTPIAEMEELQDQGDGRLLVLKDKWQGHNVGKQIDYYIDNTTKRIYKSHQQHEKIWG